MSELTEGVLDPWRRGESVSYRPPGWVARHRPGAVEVPYAPVLLVEGVAAGRQELADVADLVVWVQSDLDIARARGVDRDVEMGWERVAAEEFWDEWAAIVDPFLAVDRPWERARFIVNGTPPADVAGTLLVDGPAYGGGRRTSA